MNTPCTIRRAVDADAESIAGVLAESFKEYESRYTPAGYAATTPTSDQILRRMQEGPTWLAFQAADVLGTVSALPMHGGLYVRSLAVMPSARGQHIGVLLLEHVERFAREQGCLELFLSTTPFLDRAIQLYERFGFERSAEGPHELLGTPLFTMHKRLL